MTLSNAERQRRFRERRSKEAPLKEPPMTHTERIRRIFITARTCAANFAYYRAAYKSSQSDGSAGSRPHILTQACNNFIDIGLIEWAKLFHEREHHSWQRHVANKDEFERGLLAVVKMDGEQWDAYFDEVKTYRDKFVAHLDLNRQMKIPNLGPALASLFYYAKYLREHEPIEQMMNEIEADVRGQYDACMKLAEDFHQAIAPAALEIGRRQFR
jgi:hypothetical protein